QLLFNDRDKDDFIARVVDEKGVELWRVPYAVYDLGADQDTTAAVNFSRLARLRPGYGYAGPKDEFADLPQPERDGLYIGSMREGRQELAVSIDQVARYEAPRFFKERVHWFNHATFSPGGGKLVFLHRCRLPVATRTTLSQFGSESRNGGWKKA